jgi:uncharacterized membrane protein YcaP (DUF421 family)
MFLPRMPVWEIVARVTAVYVMLLVLVRCAGKREVGQLGPLDLLAMLVLSETVSPVLTGQDTSLGAGLVASGTLLGLCATVGRLVYWFPRFERLVEGSPVVLVEDGRLHPAAERAERVTAEELAQALRRAGVADLQDVAQAVVETNGEITVVCRKA